jgi:hypothetical protein
MGKNKESRTKKMKDLIVYEFNHYYDAALSKDLASHEKIINNHQEKE